MMPFRMPDAAGWPSARRLALAAALWLLAAASVPVRAASPPTGCGGDDPSFGAIRDDFIHHHGATEMTALNRMLPAGDNTILLYRLGPDAAGHATSFRVYETNGLDTRTFCGRSMEVLGVGRGPSRSVNGFNDANSVAIDARIEERSFPLWHRRSFLVAGYDADGRPVSWGYYTARVGSRSVSFALCLLTAGLIYLLAMSAIGLSSRQPHPLADKYPAIFSSRPLRRRDALNPIYLTVNSFGQASVQKAQVILFSFIVGWLVLSMVLESGSLVDLSPTVIGLLGISGIGAVTAQITYTQRTRLSLENWSWLQKMEVFEKPEEGSEPRPRWRDLVMSNRQFDVYKLQTIIFSLAVAVAMIAGGGTNLASFSVPETLLGVLGLSQVVYVGGILTRPPAVDALDQALTELRRDRDVVATAEIQRTDTDLGGQLIVPATQTGKAAVNARRQYQEQVDIVIPMIESTLEAKVRRSALLLPGFAPAAAA